MSTEPRFDKWDQRIECEYCNATEGLRVACEGYWVQPPEYVCEACFTGQDDGPCFDDLPAVGLITGKL